MRVLSFGHALRLATLPFRPVAHAHGLFVVALIATLLSAGCTNDSGDTPLGPTSTPVQPRPSTTVPSPKDPSLPKTATETPLAPDPKFSPIPTPPRADLLELANRFKSLENRIEPLRQRGVLLEVGHTEDFALLDLHNRRPFTVEAELRLVSDNAYFFVEREINVPQDQLERSARELEDVIIPAVQRLANPNWDPGGGIDSRLTLLHARIPGVAGYYSITDLLPREVHSLSNERPMVYMSIPILQPGSFQYFATLAHELQHAAQASADPYEEAWIQEGASEYVAEAAGYHGSFEANYYGSPDTQLTGWPDDSNATLAHYGAAHNFMRYLSNLAGADELVHLLTSDLVGVDAVEAFAIEQGIADSFEAIFFDWTTDAFIRELSTEGDDVNTRFRIEKTLGGEDDFESQVNQYAADYIRLNPSKQDRRLVFEGTTEVALLPATPRSGKRAWWSNRGDSIDARLTRPFDLSGVSKATLTYALWFEVENKFDFAYVMASPNGGQTWDVLEGVHTTSEDPLDQSYGPGYTGTSGGGSRPRWVEEKVDLSDYADSTVLVRFEYITDQAVHTNGMLIDDIRIEAIGFIDDAESDNKWNAEGFYRTDNRAPQEYSVRVITLTQDEKVTEMSLDADHRGELHLPAHGPPRVVVVAAAAPKTSVSATYRIDLENLD